MPGVSSPRKQVWISTPFRHLDTVGKSAAEVLQSLAPHYRDPILEVGNWPDRPWEIFFAGTGGGGIFQARNKLVTDFMEQCKDPEDIFLCVDYDLMPSAQDYVNLLCHDLAIVGGLYTVRSDNGHWVLNKLNGSKPNASGMLPVMELGTGFKRFKRSTLQKVLDDNPWLICESDVDHRRKVYCFFSMGPVWDKQHWPGRGRALTEDYWLDWLCRESGFTTVADTKIKLKHKDDVTGKIYPAVFPADPGILPREASEP